MLLFELTEGTRLLSTCTAGTVQRQGRSNTTTSRVKQSFQFIQERWTTQTKHSVIIIITITVILLLTLGWLVETDLGRCTGGQYITTTAWDHLREEKEGGRGGREGGREGREGREGEWGKGREKKELEVSTLQWLHYTSLDRCSRIICTLLYIVQYCAYPLATCISLIWVQHLQMSFFAAYTICLYNITTVAS